MRAPRAPARTTRPGSRQRRCLARTDHDLIVATALARLAKAHLRVELTGFGPLPAGYGLTDAPVADQDPEAPVLVRANSVVRLDMHGLAPIPSPAFPIHHPKTVTVPDVVGLSWRKAARMLSNPGFWVRVDKVPALGAVRPAEVADRYVVREIEPAAGTKLVWGGTRIPHGIRVTVVKVEIGVR